MTDPRVAEIKPQEPIELLPLPEPDRGSIRVNREDVSLGHSDEQMQAYARVNLRAALEKERAMSKSDAWQRHSLSPEWAIKPQSDVAEQLARRFHDTYERLAPSFGYETRAGTKQFDPHSANGKLMIAVCAEIAHPPITQSVAPVASEPVAYLYKSPHNLRSHLSTERYEGGLGPDTIITPLYAHPPVQPVSAEMQQQTLKACPFCGMKPDEEDHDTLYPTGVYWRDHEEGIRGYHPYKERQQGDGRCWGVNCPTPSGGCGAHISADSKEEAIAAWNRRPAVAPVASKSVEDCMRLAQEWLNADHAIACVDIMDAGNQADRAEDAHVALHAAIERLAADAYGEGVYDGMNK